MLIEIAHVLGASQLARVHELIAGCAFDNGAASAESAARAVKHNQEIRGDEPRLAALNEIVMGNLVRHPLYRAAALPRHVAAPFYARYRRGDGYGTHIDNPLMGSGEPYRSDLAITVFLSDPADYDGGELVIENGSGERRVKLAAGDAVLYAADNPHRVDAVTRGERLVAVTWVQSLVRGNTERALLFELGQARDRLRRARAPVDEVARLDRVYANLVRLWAEP